ncbi:hypothetical protein [Aliiruegeria sabulilitoris]|uniref:DUF5983 family protein n=1 Tax=Aliiruegeria sabulilitoris TaxID=1510458 RepID=UPI00082A2C11|nr:hypothetical protein [Aliiruegeria sabulilitoris]NDR56318.1 hypothetical protein [Pseudoruegeria sp. M32A2M]
MAIVEVGPIRALFMLDLSTDHLPNETRRQIRLGEFYQDPTFLTEYGFVFYIGECPHPEAECRTLAACPCPAFRAAMKLAWSLNLKFVSFDQDAKIHDGIDGLPTYEP